VWGIIEAPQWGWTDGRILGAFAAALLALAAFAVWETRTAHPMLDVRLFRNRRFSAASGAITLSFFALFGAIFFLTQYLQLILGYAPFGAGLRVLPVAAGIILASPISAKLTVRAGAKVIVAAGLTLIAVALLLMTGFEVDSSYSSVALSYVLLGMGIGLAMTPATDSVMGSLPLAKASVGSAVNDATRTTGGALGVAVLGSLLSSGYRADMDAAVSGLPASAADAARDSLGGAIAVAAHGGGSRLATTAQEAFVSGMHSAVMVAAAIALAGALIALVFLPARAPEQAVEAHAAPEALAA
jgi:predicted MFS family arabinose efflux permease